MNLLPLPAPEKTKKNSPLHPPLMERGIFMVGGCPPSKGDENTNPTASLPPLRKYHKRNRKEFPSHSERHIHLLKMEMTESFLSRLGGRGLGEGWSLGIAPSPRSSLQGEEDFFPLFVQANMSILIFEGPADARRNSSFGKVEGGLPFQN